MIILNLHEPASALLIEHMASKIIPGMTDKEFLEHEIQKWLASTERKRQLEGEAYYDGIQEILNRKREVINEKGELEEVKHLPNNHIVDNQYAKMVDQKANYLCGRPVTFDTKSKEYGEALTSVFSQKMQRAIRNVAVEAVIGGKAWIFPHYNGQGELAFAVFPAHEILPFWADADHTDLDCAVHLFPVYVYDEKGQENIVNKVEVMHAGGIERFVWDKGQLIYDNDAPSGAYLTVTDKDTGKETPYNWERAPLICFKSNHREIPLLCRVKCLQDGLNLLLSNLANNMEEDVHKTVLVVHNYDGANLGEFRKNLAVYNSVKVRSVDGCDGGVEKLTIEVDAENYQTVIDIFKKAIIANARGYDAKDERMNGTPNQLNIRSMYSDIDLDANGMEVEFQAAFDDLLWFVNTYMANAGLGNYFGEKVRVIFDRDILINETEAIDNCIKSRDVISNETIVRQHPWISDPEEELERIHEEKLQAVKEIDEYRNAFESTAGNNRQEPPEGGAVNE